MKTTGNPNPGAKAGGTYGRDTDDLARRSKVHVDRDNPGKARRAPGEPTLDVEPGAHAPRSRP